MSRNCPCHGCQDRTVTCHGVCGRYQGWKKEYNENEQAKKDARPINGRHMGREARRKWIERMKRGR